MVAIHLILRAMCVCVCVPCVSVSCVRPRSHTRMRSDVHDLHCRVTLYTLPCVYTQGHTTLTRCVCVCVCFVYLHVRAFVYVFLCVCVCVSVCAAHTLVCSFAGVLRMQDPPATSPATSPATWHATFHEPIPYTSVETRREKGNCKANAIT